MENMNHRDKLIEIYEKQELHLQERIEKCEKNKEEYKKKLEFKNELKEKIIKIETETAERKTDIMKEMQESIQLQHRNYTFFEDLQKITADSKKSLMKSTHFENSTEIIKNTISNLNQLSVKNDPNQIRNEIQKYAEMRDQINEKIDSTQLDLKLLSHQKSNVYLSEFQLTDEMKAVMKKND